MEQSKALFVAVLASSLFFFSPVSFAATQGEEAKRLDRIEQENRELRKDIEALKVISVRHRKHNSDFGSSGQAISGDQAHEAAGRSRSERIAHGDRLLNLNSEFSYQMLDPTTSGKSKPLTLLRAKQDGSIGADGVYLGGALTALADYQLADHSGQFGYMMRQPENQIGRTASEAVLHSAQFSVTANIETWISAYAEALWDPEQSFGAGTITSLNRNELQLRRGYVLLGDLDEFPVYLMLGKIDSPFGQTDTVNPFSLATDWHTFSGLSYGALLGYSSNGLNVTFEAVQGGAEFRGLNTPVGGTNVPSSLNNYVIDANYTLSLGGEDRTFLVGASYEAGSSYCQSFPVAHFDSCAVSNPAYAVYSALSWGAFRLKGEYAETVNVWPGTFNPNPPLNVFPASKVSSFDLGGKYITSVLGRELDLSVDYSALIAGPAGSPWEQQSQAVFGAGYFIRPNVKLFSEVVLVHGYEPLMFISGGIPGDPPGQTDSNAHSNSQILLMGINLAL